MVAEVKKQLFDDTCCIPVEVVAEMVYVLSKVYKIQRDVVAKTLTNLTYMQIIRVAQKNVVLYALDVYAASTFDFVDCLMTGYAIIENYTIFTFDKKLKNYLNKIGN
jgi:predicted nucleic-acid-binding protein